MQELSKALNFERVLYIHGNGGDKLSIRDDINLQALTSGMYEVGGIPADDDWVSEVENIMPDAIEKGDKFERRIWDDVVHFLENGTFPADKVKKKAQENFTRRCKMNYTLGMPNEKGEHYTLHPEDVEKRQVRSLPCTLKKPSTYPPH